MASVPRECRKRKTLIKVLNPQCGRKKVYMNNTLKNIGSFATSFAVSYAVTSFVRKCCTAANERQRELPEQPINYYRVPDQKEAVRRDLDKMGLGHLVR